MMKQVGFRERRSIEMGISIGQKLIVRGLW